MKLGSLFDGVGGFPLAGQSAGIEAVWASEIEPFPITVTKKHFPNMKHLGDITKVKGNEIEPVDIITFGSPCQDLSIAGKRAGFEGQRSGLFMEAIRIIREMRDKTNGLYPRLAVWENVPGAFSSNDRQDFRAVLEEILETPIPMPRSGKWANSGMVRGNGRSLAWRVFDSQYWGVPQRRRRIYLVADFGGQCAPEILFESGSVSGHLEEIRKARQEAACGLGDGPDQTSEAYTMQMREGCEGGGKGPLIKTEHVGCLSTVNNNIIFAPQIDCTPDGISGTVSSKWHKGTGGPAGDEHYNLICEPVMLEAHPHDSRIKIDETGKAQTLTRRMGTGGGNVPMLMEPIPFACNQRSEVRELGDKAVALQAEPGMNQQTFVAEVAHALRATHRLSHREDMDNLAVVNYAVRKLTPVECERLQGLPDNWTEGGSDSARYKAIGNGLAIVNPKWILQQARRVLGE